MGDNVIFQLQLTMFLMLMAGFLCARRNLLTPKGRESLVNVFINIMIPCSIVHAFYTNLTMEILTKGILMVFAYLFNLTFCWILSKFLYLRVERDKRGILKYATIISNAQFMGFPIVQAALGGEGLMMASLAMIPGTVFTWTIALAQFTRVDGKQGVKSVLTHPCFWSVIIGVLLSISKVPLHPSIIDGMERMGNCVMPVSMLIIGSLLAGANMKEVLDWKLYYYSLIRLGVVPITLYFIFSAVHLDNLVKNTTVIMAAMPAGTVTAMLAEKHGADAQFASQVILVSTILSIISLSILYIFIMG